MTIYPNPVLESLRIDGLQHSNMYTIMDVIGNVVQTGTAEPLKSIDVNELVPGVYIFNLSNQYTFKIIKK